MKPKSNSYWCADCNRPKMKFETEKKAHNFIKYNGADILKEGQTIDQIRVYYCPSCCAYHITTKPYKKAYEYRTRELIEKYNKDKANKAILNVLKDTDNKVIKEIQIIAQKASITSIKALKEVINDYFERHKEYNLKKQEEIRHKINLLLKNINNGKKND